MGFLPELVKTSKSNIYINEFSGLNHTNYLSSSELYDEKNISTREYPYLATRKRRASFVDSNNNSFGNYEYSNGSTVNCNGITTKNGFCFAEGNRFYYRIKNASGEYEYNDVGAVENSPKQFVSLGAYILIFPDKKYFNSIMYLHGEDEQWLSEHNLTKSPFFGELEASVTFPIYNNNQTIVKITACDVYGEEYNINYRSDVTPTYSASTVGESFTEGVTYYIKNGSYYSISTDTSPVAGRTYYTKTAKDGEIWEDTSKDESKLMQYSESYNGWVELTTTYIKLTFKGDYTDIFHDYDGIELSGMPITIDNLNSSYVTYYVNGTDDGLYTSFVIPGIINPKKIASDNPLMHEILDTYGVVYWKAIYEIDFTVGQNISNSNVIPINETIDADVYEHRICKLNNKYYIITANTTSNITLKNIDGTAASITCNQGDGILDDNFQITIQRKVPNMDYVCELDNRIWGCSSANHEIYASKTGNPFNFNSFAGISTDSYVLSVGSDGDFTGCIAHLGYVLFFKEDCIHKIYGTKPTNYQLTTINMRGVQQGCNKSLCITNETLFYKSKNGVMAYQGALPERISSELGEYSFSNAVADVCDSSYYISMLNETLNVYELYVYNTETGLWSKEDNTQFLYTLSTSTDLFYINENYELHSINGTGDSFKVKRLISNDNGNSTYLSTEYVNVQESQYDWMLESGWIEAGNIDKKYISKIRALIEIQKDTKIEFFVKYDNASEWRCIGTKSYKYIGNQSNEYNLPVIPRRCQRIKYKISGQGECLIKGIAMTVENGSEM